MEEQEQSPQRIAIKERSLEACLFLQRTLYRAAWQECSFSCHYPQGMAMPQPRVVSGNVAATVQAALLSFMHQYDIDDDVWDWMLAVTAASFENQAEHWQMWADGSLQDWKTAQWIREKLSKIKLGWLLGKDDDFHREQVSEHAITVAVADMIKDALEQWIGGGGDDEEEFVPV
ncbi:MAG: hypothetical protein Q7R81_02985 [Candidatus Peregrinibacteria bacterium]|nr:hypothetical protein [Candidatus Peregrinibacteria bacterium]